MEKLKSPVIRHKQIGAHKLINKLLRKLEFTPLEGSELGLSLLRLMCHLSPLHSCRTQVIFIQKHHNSGITGMHLYAKTPILKDIIFLVIAIV
jgi:hypothetical protein